MRTKFRERVTKPFRVQPDNALLKCNIQHPILQPRSRIKGSSTWRGLLPTFRLGVQFWSGTTLRPYDFPPHLGYNSQHGCRVQYLDGLGGATSYIFKTRVSQHGSESMNPCFKHLHFLSVETFNRLSKGEKDSFRLNFTCKQHIFVPSSKVVVQHYNSNLTVKYSKEKDVEGCVCSLISLMYSSVIAHQQDTRISYFLMFALPTRSFLSPFFSSTVTALWKKQIFKT